MLVFTSVSAIKLFEQERFQRRFTCENIDKNLVYSSEQIVLSI